MIQSRRASVLFGIALALSVGGFVWRSLVSPESDAGLPAAPGMVPAQAGPGTSLNQDEGPAADLDELVLVLPPLDPKDDKESREVVAFARSAGLGEVASLERMLEVDQPLVVGNAVRALGRLGLFTPGSKYVRLLTDERVRVRQESVRALGLCGDPAAVVELEQVLASGSNDERRLAIEALGELGGPAARAALESIEPADPTERAFHERAMGRVDRTLRTPASER
ncbi:MAG: hypothetical protein ACI8QZ_002956 [Chlamydiales bacterium]|jgi:hypothetical protein